MKLFRAFLILLILALFCEADAQNTVTDPCLGYRTTYTRINDSVYHVEYYYKEHLLFDGGVMYPDTALQYDSLYYNQEEDERYYSLYNNHKRHHGLCRFYTINRGMTEQSIYDYGQLKEGWYYNDGKPYRHTITNETSYTDEDVNTDGSIATSHVFDRANKLRTIITYANKKECRTVEVYDSMLRDYKPFKRKTNYYNTDGSLIKTVVLYKNSMIRQREIAYSDGKVQSETEYDRNGNSGTTIYYERPNMKSTIITKTISVYDDKRHLLYMERFRNGKKVAEFKKDTILQTIHLLENNDVFYGNWHKPYYASRIYQRDSNNQIKLEMWHGDSFIYLKKYVNGALKRSRRFHSINYSRLLINRQEFMQMDENMHYLLEDFLHLDIDFDTELMHSYDYFASKPCFSDTLYDNGKYCVLTVKDHDTVSRYRMQNNLSKLEYCNYQVRIAKDVSQCGEGLKNRQNNWVVKANFYYISQYDTDTNTLYFASASNYTAVYNWKGEAVILPTRGLEYLHIPLSKVLQDSTGLEHDDLFIVNDLVGNNYCLLNGKNEVVRNLPNKIYYIEPNRDYNNMSRDPSFFLSDSSGKTGYFNFYGTYIPCKYLHLMGLPDGGIAAKSAKYKYEFLDASGRRICTENIGNCRIVNDSCLIATDSLKHPRVYNFHKHMYTTSPVNYTLDMSEQTGITFLVYDGKYYGIADQALNLLLPVEYVGIEDIEGKHVARKEDSIFFFNDGFELIRGVKADVFFMLDYSEYSDSRTYLYFFKVGEKCGIVSHEGKVLLPAIYDDICQAQLGQGNYFLFKNDSISFAQMDIDSGTFIIENNSGNSQFSVFQSFKNSTQEHEYSLGILNAFNKVVAMGIDPLPEEENIITPIYKEGEYLGNINSMGDWVFSNPGYKNIQPIDKALMYVRGQDNMSGVVNCSGNVVIPLKYDCLFYDRSNETVWYNCIVRESEEDYHYNDYMNIWKIKRGSVELTDTFYYPVNFGTRDYCVLVNNHGMYGVVNRKLDIVMPFIFTEIKNIGSCNILSHTNGEKWICDDTFGIIKKCIIDLINPSGDKTYVASRNEMMYLVDSQFNFTDSSFIFFINRPEIRFNYFWLSDKAIYSYNDSLVASVNNFVSIIQDYYLEYPSYWPIGYIGYDEIFPNHEVSSDYEEEEEKPIAVHSQKSSIQFSYQKAYRPRHLHVNHLENLVLGRFVSQSKKTVSYETHNRILGESGIQSFYVDHSSGVFYIPLEELIDNKDHFVALLKKHMARIENPLVPCVTNNDYLEFFRTNFSIADEGFMFYLNDGYDFVIPVEEMKEVMHPYWKERL